MDAISLNLNRAQIGMLFDGFLIGADQAAYPMPGCVKDFLELVTNIHKANGREVTDGAYWLGLAGVSVLEEPPSSCRLGICHVGKTIIQRTEDGCGWVDLCDLPVWWDAPKAVNEEALF